MKKKIFIIVAALTTLSLVAFARKFEAKEVIKCCPYCGHEYTFDDLELNGRKLIYTCTNCGSVDTLVNEGGRYVEETIVE